MKGNGRGNNGEEGKKVRDDDCICHGQKRLFLCTNYKKILLDFVLPTRI